MSKSSTNPNELNNKWQPKPSSLSAVLPYHIPIIPVTYQLQVTSTTIRWKANHLFSMSSQFLISLKYWLSLSFISLLRKFAKDLSFLRYSLTSASFHCVLFLKTSHLPSWSPYTHQLNNNLDHYDNEGESADFIQLLTLSCSKAGGCIHVNGICTQYPAKCQLWLNVILVPNLGKSNIQGMSLRENALYISSKGDILGRSTWNREEGDTN